jgi:hypothetical protein
MLTDEEKALLLQGARVITAVDAGRDPNGNPIDVHWLAGYTWGAVQELHAKLDALASNAAALAQVPALVAGLAELEAKLEAGDLGAVRAALASQKAGLDALSRHLGQDLPTA